MLCGIRRQQKVVESVEDNKCSTKLESENLFTNLASKLSETQKIFWCESSASLGSSHLRGSQLAASGSQWPQSGHRCDLPLRGKSRPL